ncbi:MAG: hypothetical protein HYW24_03995 [Candidatus Aenigmarchaeota archaeon]|nr:hypothetical protein [Candidatus Aenigmarchaeota archaeon]
MTNYVLLSDVHGPVLDTHLGTETLMEGSISSMRYLKNHMDSGKEPRIIAVVTGDSEPTIQQHFRHVGIKIEYGVFEHGLGIKLPGKNVLPVYDVDSRYEWLREPVEQLAQLSVKLKRDMPNNRHSDKLFFVAPYKPDYMSPENFKEYIKYHVDGFLDMSKFDFKYSHGAVDILPKGANKRIGVIVLKDMPELRNAMIYGLEDNNWEWLVESHYAMCPTPSSDETLNYVGGREENGTGKILRGDYSNMVIKQAIELIQHEI